MDVTLAHGAFSESLNFCDLHLSGLVPKPVSGQLTLMFPVCSISGELNVFLAGPSKAQSDHCALVEIIYLCVRSGKCVVVCE